jgi:hypothetical protein
MGLEGNARVEAELLLFFRERFDCFLEFCIRPAFFPDYFVAADKTPLRGGNG